MSSSSIPFACEESVFLKENLEHPLQSLILKVVFAKYLCYIIGFKQYHCTAIVAAVVYVEIIKLSDFHQMKVANMWHVWQYLKSRSAFRYKNCFKKFICNFVFSILVDYVAGGELFTHLYQREHFTKDQVRIYIGEIILALEHLHSVSTLVFFSLLYLVEVCVWVSRELAKQIS